jgi:hypothetical protein
MDLIFSITTDYWFFGVLGIAFVLLFKNLGDQSLRLDEARTAILARNVLKHGYPTVWDGVNPPCIFNSEYNRHYVSVLHTWLQYYLAALSFRVFGVKARSARLPFAACGLLAVIATYLLALQISASVSVARVAALLLTGCVSYLLLARQARYYALAFLFETLLLLSCLYFFANPTGLAALALVASGALLFYSDWPLWVVTTSAISVYFLFFDYQPHMVFPFALSLGGMLLLIVPWWIYQWRSDFQSAAGGMGPHGRITDLFKTFKSSFLVYGWKVHVYFFPLPTLYIVYLGLGVLVGRIGFTPGLLRLLPQNEKYWLLLLVILADLGARSFTRVIFTRYILGTIIPSAILAAALVAEMFSMSLFIGMLVLATLLLTDILHHAPYWVVRLFHISPSWVPFLKVPQVQFVKGPSLRTYLDNKLGPRSYLREYLYEITHHYETRTEGIVRYLAQHGREGQVIVADPLEAPALSFHSQMVVVPYGKSNPKGKADHLTVDPFGVAHWVVGGGFSLPEMDPEFMARSAEFEPVYVPAIDVFMDNTESLDRHHFRTLAKLRGLYLYARKTPIPSAPAPVHGV